ncbi:MAG: hypothetical protein WKG07_01470 [Hymenobacter sp.]
MLTPTSQCRELLDYLVVSEKYCHSFYQQLPPATRPLPALPPIFTATERLTYHLDLSPAAEALRQGYAADYRRRLRRNHELPAPLTVTAAGNLDELLVLFLSYRPAEHTGLRPRHYAPLRRLWPPRRPAGWPNCGRCATRPPTNYWPARCLLSTMAG